MTLLHDSINNRFLPGKPFNTLSMKVIPRNMPAVEVECALSLAYSHKTGAAESAQSSSTFAVWTGPLRILQT